MKKMLLAVMLLGFGFMVGCGDDTTTKKTTGTSATKATSTTTTTTDTKTTGDKPKGT
jgi:hypothetical protein